MNRRIVDRRAQKVANQRTVPHHGVVPALMTFAVLLTSATGCATCANGTTQMVHVSSNPAGANVLVDGNANQLTPCNVELKRNTDYTLHISKPGYQPLDVPMARVTTGKVSGNVWIGGLIGWLVDLGTGANYKFVPEEVQVALVPEPAASEKVEAASSSPPTDTRRFASVDEVGAPPEVSRTQAEEDSQ